MTRKRRPGIDLARDLRQRDVPAESILWQVLRNRALGGFKFRRQFPVASYVVDFACLECRLVVEVDGESHLERRWQDEVRTQKLKTEGWAIMRFWNTAVYDELDSVKEAIYRRCMERASSAESK